MIIIYTKFCGVSEQAQKQSACLFWVLNYIIVFYLLHTHPQCNKYQLIKSKVTFSYKFLFLFIQSFCIFYFTVTVHLIPLLLTVIVAFPLLFAFIFPFEFIVATFLLLDLNVALPFLFFIVSCNVLPFLIVTVL